jgi:hypothetical protein
MIKRKIIRISATHIYNSVLTRQDEIRMAALLDQHNRIALAIIRDGKRFGLDHLSRVNRRRRLELREEVK